MASENKKRNIKKRKNLSGIVILLFSLFLILLAVNIYILLSAPLKEETLDVKFIVGNSWGIDLNSSALTFGIVLPESVVNRDINIENQYDFSVSVKVLVSKNIADLLSVEKNYIIGSKSSLSFPIFLNVPKNYSYGNYTGKVKIEVRKKYR